MRLRARWMAAVAVFGLALAGGWLLNAGKGETRSSSTLAPEFTGITGWVNSDTLTLSALRGRVVLVEFWTSECVNCLRTLPYVTAWYEKYRAQGFLVVGVHSPETDLERGRAHVEQAMQKHGIAYPVALDNDFATWGAYRNLAWPASYLIDRSGRIVRRHYGEGGYDEMEAAIRSAIEEDGAAVE